MQLNGRHRAMSLPGPHEERSVLAAFVGDVRDPHEEPNTTAFIRVDCNNNPDFWLDIHLSPEDMMKLLAQLRLADIGAIATYALNERRKLDGLIPAAAVGDD